MDFFDQIELERLLNNLYSGAVNPSRLPTDLYNKTLKTLLDAVYKGFGGTLGDFPEDTSNNLLLKHYERNIAIFSGAKTFQQVKDMSQAVLAPEGYKRDYNEFKRIVTGDEFHEGIFNKYNKNYLKTEYNTAISTAQMGSEWNQYVEDADVFPYLKYVTAHDERVRHSHQLFDGVIQPVGSEFWNTHVPPNGFNCRCRLVQLNPEDDVFSVTPDDHIKNLPKTDSPLFGMNPAKSGYIFDPSIHPYTKNIEERFKVASEQNFGFPTPPIPPAIKPTNIVTPKVTTSVERAKEEINAFKNTLTEEEVGSVYNYSFNYFDRMNEILRSKNTDTSRFAPNIVKLVDTLKSVLTKAPKIKIKTFRGITFYEESKFNDFVANIENKEYYYDKGFMSTSYSKEIAKSFCDGNMSVLIEVEGKSGVLIETMSEMAPEKEVLFNSKTRFEILQYKRIGTKIVMKIKEI